MSDGDNAKVAEHHAPIFAQQHIVWFDIPVNQLMLVGILQGAGHLLHIRENLWEWERLPARMAGTQRPERCVLHHEKGHALLHIEVQHTDNIWMGESGNRLGFSSKAL